MPYLTNNIKEEMDPKVETMDGLNTMEPNIKTEDVKMEYDNDSCDDVIKIDTYEVQEYVTTSKSVDVVYQQINEPDQETPKDHLDTQPHLVLVEQPVGQFRFRYISERSISHGCLHGRTSKKLFPTVELKNYSGEAVVVCTLVQVDETHDPHPHRLVILKTTDVIDNLRVKKISRKNGFRAIFQGLSVLYTTKKMIVEELKQKHKPSYMKIKDQDLCLDYKNVVKNINMNSVCLKFSVFDLENRELCPPVYSEPIDNTKCAETCQLKIVNMSKMSGSCQGEDLILLFVEKVNKKNIKVRFFEMQKGVRVWEAFGSFSESDVHHQYGIAFKTPPYNNVYLKDDVNVFLELYRPKDHAVSPKMPFCYKASTRHYKKSRIDEKYAVETNMRSNDIPARSPVTVKDIVTDNEMENNRVGSVTAVSAQPLYTFNIFPRDDDSCFGNLNLENLDDLSFGHIDPIDFTSIINGNFFGDTEIENGFHTEDINVPKINNNEAVAKSIEKWPTSCNKNRLVFNQFLSAIKQRPKLWPENIKLICELAEENLSRNNNLIHLLILMNCEKLLSKMLDILNANYSHKLMEILDKINLDGLAPLHIATEYSYSESVKLLLKRDCNPNIKYTEDGFTSYHIAVKNNDEECLKCLLHYNKLNIHYGYVADCNLANSDGYTALHLAVMKGSLPLLICIKDNKDFLDLLTNVGQNMLHLAVEYGHVDIVKYLLINSMVDPNGSMLFGYTPLHMACGLEGKKAIEIVTILLENKADPLKVDGMNRSPWMLVVNNKNKNIIKIMKNYLPQEMAPCERDNEMSSSEESLSSASTEIDEQRTDTSDDEEMEENYSSLLDQRTH